LKCTLEEFKKIVKEKRTKLVEGIDSYEFEKTISEELFTFSHDLYQTICGEELSFL
jgi:hypothetical protein